MIPQDHVQNIVHNTLMEPSSGTILHFETVDKREVYFKSPNMECEGLKRALDFLNKNNIKVKEVVTDASITIITFIG